MNFREAIQAFIAWENRYNDGFVNSPVTQVFCAWNSGDNWDPTYGDRANDPPTFEIAVITADDHRYVIPPDWAIRNLMLAQLGLECEIR